MKKYIAGVILSLGFVSQVYSQCTPIIGSNPDLTTGCEDLTIQFSDNSTCLSLERKWDFGDGSAISNVQNPSHTFIAGVIGDTTYTVTLEKQDLGGTWFNSTKLITVYKKPEVSFDVSKLTACIIIDTLQLTNTSPMPAGTSLSWDFGDGSALSSDPTPKHTFTSAAVSSYNVRLTITNTNNCSNVASKTIAVNEIPNPNFTMDANIGCDPLVVNFNNTTAEGAFPVTDWSWDFGGQGTEIVKSPGSFTFNGAALYPVSLSATNTAGCTNTTTNNLVVKKTPTVSFNLPSSICVGDTATISYTGDGDPTAAYVWDFPNAQSSTGNSVGPYKLTYAIAGLQKVILEVTENGCVKKDSATLVVNALPTLSLVSSDVDDLICEGEQVVFSAQPAGYDKYIFYDQGIEVQNGASDFYQTNTLLSPNSVTVVAEDGNSCQSIASNAIVTNVNTKPVITISAASTTVCETDTVVITATGSFDEYTFSRGFLTLQAGASNVLKTTLLDDGDVVTAYATHLGCQGAESNAVTITEKTPVAKPVINCAGATNNSVTVTWNDDPSITTYELSVNNGGYYSPVVRDSETIAGLNPNDTVWFQLFGNAALPCGNTLVTDSIFCVAQPCTPISFVANTTASACEGDVVNLTISSLVTASAQYGISWEGGTFGKDQNYQFTAGVSQLVTVELNDSSQLACPTFKHSFAVDVSSSPVAKIQSSSGNLCEGLTHTFSADTTGYDQFEYFLNGTKVQDSAYNAYSTAAIPVGVNQLVLVTTEASCVAKDTLDFNLIQKVTSSMTPSSLTICAGDSVVFSASGNFAEYIFTNTITGDTLQDSTIKVLATSTVLDVTLVTVDAFGCLSNPSTAQVSATALPVVSIAGSKTSGSTICANESITLTATSATGTSFDFYDNTQLVQTGALQTYITDSIQDQHNYFVRAQLNGCVGSSSDTIKYIVESIPVAVLSADTATLCVGSGSNFSATGGSSYTWSTGESGTNINFAPVTTSYLWVTATEGNCTSFPDSAHVFVDANPPTASAGLDDEVCRYQSIQLSATGGQTYQWVSGDSIADPLSATTDVTPLETDTFKVLVTNVVCVDSAEVIITVDRCLTELPKDLPQVITPNGDGKNDELVFEDIDYFPTAKLIVYNRWSNAVFEGENYNNDWKGTTTNGNELPDGTYFYVLDLGNGSAAYTNYIMIQR